MTNKKKAPIKKYLLSIGSDGNDVRIMSVGLEIDKKTFDKLDNFIQKLIK